MRRTLLGVVAVAMLVPLLGTPRHAHAQAPVTRAALGGALGVAGGAAVTLATVVARARFQREFLESADDLIHWQSAPMIVAPAAGVLFGLAGEDALRASIVGSTAGLVIGAAIGAGVGWLATGDPEGPWAFGVIGGGVGLATGGIVEALRAWSEDEHADLEYPRMLRIAFTLPVR